MMQNHTWDALTQRILHWAGFEPASQLVGVVPISKRMQQMGDPPQPPLKSYALIASFLTIKEPLHRQGFGI